MRSIFQTFSNKHQEVDFKEVIGQQETIARLVKMADEQRLPHALLFTGPEGCGKMAVAMAFASYLLTRNESQRRNAEAMLAKWQHPDLYFSYPVIRPAGTNSDHKMESDDFAREWNAMIMEGPYFTMDQWLERMGAANQQAVMGVGESDSLLRKMALKSSQGGYKVSIIWQPERMNAASANKLLKLLEEPPQQTVFIMVSEEPERLLETIRSRTQRINVKRISTQAIEQALVERRAIGQDDANRIARLANGSWPRALEALDSDSENSQFLEMFMLLMRYAYKQDLVELKLWSEDVAAFGREKQKRMLAYFLQQVRENFIYNFHEAELNYQTRDEEDFSRNFARFINEANVVEISELYQRALRDIGQNANGKVVFFELALQTVILIKKK